jgi:hypothetical protein
VGLDDACFDLLELLVRAFVLFVEGNDSFVPFLYFFLNQLFVLHNKKVSRQSVPLLILLLTAFFSLHSSGGWRLDVTCEVAVEIVGFERFN